MRLGTIATSVAPVGEPDTSEVVVLPVTTVPGVAETSSITPLAGLPPPNRTSMPT